MECESTISSGRSWETTPPADPGLGELGRLMVWVISSSERNARTDGPCVRTRYAFGPGTALPCVFRTEAGIKW